MDIRRGPVRCRQRQRPVNGESIAIQRDRPAGRDGVIQHNVGAGG